MNRFNDPIWFKTLSMKVILAHQVLALVKQASATESTSMTPVAPIDQSSSRSRTTLCFMWKFMAERAPSTSPALIASNMALCSSTTRGTT